MGVRVFVGREQGDPLSYLPGRAFLFDSVTGVPLPVEQFRDETMASAFVKYVERETGRDLRTLTERELAEHRQRFEGE